MDQTGPLTSFILLSHQGFIQQGLLYKSLVTYTSFYSKLTRSNSKLISRAQHFPRIYLEEWLAHTETIVYIGKNFRFLTKKKLLSCQLTPNKLSSFTFDVYGQQEPTLKSEQDQFFPSNFPFFLAPIKLSKLYTSILYFL